MALNPGIRDQSNLGNIATLSLLNFFLKRKKRLGCAQERHIKDLELYIQCREGVGKLCQLPDGHWGIGLWLCVVVGMETCQAQ
jgi:hypothetical protein